MNQIENYLKKWNLTDPKKLAETATSHVYRVYQGRIPVVLKILTQLGRTDEADGAIALKHYAGKGAVELLNSDEGAHLLSFADGRFLKEIVIEGRDSEATEIICDVLEKLHARPAVIPSDLCSLEENFRALFRHAEESSGYPILSEAVEVAERLLSGRHEKVVLHGDIHHKNILESTARGWVAIDPKGLVGERTYDFANIFFNPDDIPSLVEGHARIEETCALLSRRFHVNRLRILEFAFAYGCLSACWSIDDGLNPDRRLRIAGLIRDLLKRDGQNG